VIIQNYPTGYNSLFGFKTGEENIVFNISSWLNWHSDYFIASPPSQATFCSLLQPYFPNLYLNPNTIPASLGSFRNPSYGDVMKSIIYHLRGLNDFYYDCFKTGKAGDSACEELENNYKNKELRIEASRDRNDIENLNIDFYDESTNTKKTLYCDLHTKFKQYFEIEAPSQDQRSKRLYFHFPLEGFLEGRVLIALIGAHQ
jgi:hypothetical protein